MHMSVHTRPLYALPHPPKLFNKLICMHKQVALHISVLLSPFPNTTQGPHHERISLATR